mmetsp:Transcript_24898/g.28785  ORF Transcript_24898/g.28785 Transcript_24898/m.28785 type:complete len:144 (+) Transcript_24898:360-791(+)
MSDYSKHRRRRILLHINSLVSVPTIHRLCLLKTTAHLLCYLIIIICSAASSCEATSNGKIELGHQRLQHSAQLLFNKTTRRCILRGRPHYSTSFIPSSRQFLRHHAIYRYQRNMFAMDHLICFTTVMHIIWTILQLPLTLKII